MRDESKHSFGIASLRACKLGTSVGWVCCRSRILVHGHCLLSDLEDIPYLFCLFDRLPLCYGHFEVLY